ncbi:MAG: hypothetical protein UV60_C0006G0081 [Parcubacteria group bacterium GW2011_GWA2_43_11]|nr:MAG: hypothetical protein UU89_C0002G0014 [Parcubacteria group bacterium GW2011_GWC2_42_11]KKS85729.1 MAG: hypothetical protein UV60_C0006G0081 [Parcubacteria group bacterium GW2011_GWA2_43_11]
MKRINSIGRLALLGIIIFPSNLFAQVQDFKSIATIFVNLLNTSVLLIMAMAVFFFVIGAIRFIATAGDDKSRSEGKQMMVWGTLSLFVMVAVWGIVNIIRTTFFG